MRNAWLPLALVVACGGAQVSPEAPAEEVGAVEAPPPPPRDPLSCVPADASGVVTVHLAALRSWPHFVTLRSWLPAMGTMTPDREHALDELLERADTVHFVLAPGRLGDSLDLGSVVLKGRFEPGAGQRLLLRLVDPRAAERMNTVEVEGRPGIGDGNAALVEVEEGLYVLGEYDTIRPVIRAPAGPAALEGAIVPSLLASLPPGEAAVEGWLVGGEVVRSTVASQTPLGPDAASELVALAYRLDLSSGVRLTARARMASPEAAGRLAAEVRRRVDDLTQSLPARAFGLDILGPALQLSTEAGDVLARLELSDEQVSQLLDRLGGLAHALAGAR